MRDRLERRRRVLYHWQLDVIGEGKGEKTTAGLQTTDDRSRRELEVHFV